MNYKSPKPTRVKKKIWEQSMGHMWLRRLSRIWGIFFPHNTYTYMWPTHFEKKKWHECGHAMGNCGQYSA